MKSMKFVKSYEIGAGTTNTYAPATCASTKLSHPPEVALAERLFPPLLLATFQRVDTVNFGAKSKQPAIGRKTPLAP